MGTAGECDAARITVLDENFVDILLTDSPGTTHFGMDQQFDVNYGEILAENGICFLVETLHAGRWSRTLFDAGLTSTAVLHNAAVMGVDLQTLDHIVISHGHPDHFGGLEGILAHRERESTVVIHPDAFDPRYIVKPHKVLPFFNRGLSRAGIERNGGRLVEAREPLPLAPGVFSSGSIPRSAVFEQEPPKGRLCIHDGAVREDEIDDHQIMVVAVKDVGAIVMDPCGHAGVISSVHYGLELSGATRLAAVLGGFHTGHPHVSKARVDRTANELLGLGPTMIAPMHCSGFPMKAAVYQRDPKVFTQATAGTVLEFGAVPQK
ncbi:MBL fold metallo-hydrolase [Pseudonocardia ailaonensis]|uniref:MBL fold metallo-hydrolase n=1 Tax=Pseudonocardia ailaonensis TaxID=367279 RepID=A0ABN2NBE3_9PSEU